MTEQTKKWTKNTLYIYKNKSYVIHRNKTDLATSRSSSDKNIIPILDTVAGEANRKSCVSNKKFTLGPKAILSPLGRVRRWLSSRTEFNDSIHSGSTSPSHIIQQETSDGSRTTYSVYTYLNFMMMMIFTHIDYDK